MVRLFHDGVCCLLSAVLLLTNGWPMAVQHAHDVGDNPYFHTHAAIYRPAADMSCAAGDGELSSVTEHVHLLFFGWELTIVPPKGCRPSCPSGTGSGMLAQLVVKSGSDRDNIAVPVSALHTLCILGQSGHSHIAPRLADLRHIAALPLCDTARHLRSGVQLA
jgi:hypothetical protein